MGLKWWRKPLEERDAKQVCDWIRQLLGHEQGAKLQKWVGSGLHGQAFINKLMLGTLPPGAPPWELDKVFKHLGLGRNPAEARASLDLMTFCFGSLRSCGVHFVAWKCKYGQS